MSAYLSVINAKGDVAVDIPLNKNGSLSMSNLVAQFPGASGLKYLNQETGTFRAVCSQDGFFYPPIDAVWPQAQYIAVTPTDKSVLIPKDHELKSESVWVQEFVKFFNEIRCNNDEIHAQDHEKILETVNSLKTLNNSFWFGNSNFGEELFIRKCYIDLAHIILNTIFERHPSKRAFKRGVALVGMPGIGKSQFLSYLFWYIYVKRKDIETIVVASVTNEEMLIVKRNGEVKGTGLHKRDALGALNVDTTICLYDPVNKRDPDRVPAEFPLFLVAACSPSTNKEAFIDQGNRKTVKQLFMPLWSEEELIETGEKSAYYWRPDLFDNLFDCIGGTMRYTLKIAQHPITLKTNAATDPEKKLVADEMISEEYQNMLDLVNMEIDKHKVTASGGIILAKDLTTPRNERHMLEHFDVTADYKRYKPKIATKYVSMELFKRLEGEEFKDRIRLMKCKDDPTHRGQVFETYVHFMFESQITLPACKHTYNELDKKVNKEFGRETFNCSRVVKFFGSSLRGRDRQLKPELVGAPSGAYCMPRYTNFKSIDSVIWPDKMLQITVSDSHDMDLEFLATQAEILKTNNNITKVCLYFVTPIDVFEKFKVENVLFNIFDEIHTVGIDLDNQDVIRAMFLGRPIRKDGVIVGVINLDDLKAVTSGTVSINQTASTAAAVDQDAFTSASVNQGASTSASVGQDATVSVSANQDVLSPGCDVTLQVGISRQTGNLKSAEAKKSMASEKGKLDANYDEAEEINTEEDSEQATGCGVGADSAEPATAAKNKSASAAARDAKYKGKLSATRKKSCTKTCKDRGHKSKSKTEDEEEEMEAEGEQVEVKAVNKKLRKQ